RCRTPGPCAAARPAACCRRFVRWSCTRTPFYPSDHVPIPTRTSERVSEKANPATAGFPYSGRSCLRLLLGLFVSLGRCGVLLCLGFNRFGFLLGLGFGCLSVFFRLGFSRIGFLLGLGRRGLFFLRLRLGGLVGSRLFGLGRSGFLGRRRAGFGRVRLRTGGV